MTMINWPALLKLAGDDELVYLPDRVAWATDADLQALVFNPDDQLIDVQGRLFALAPQGNSTTLQVTENQLTLAEVTDLVRAHESSLGSCCVAKMSFGSLAEAFAAVKFSQQT